MDKDGGLAEKERQDAERAADHEARRLHLSGGTVSNGEENPEPAPKPKPKSRSRAKSKKT